MGGERTLLGSLAKSETNSRLDKKYYMENKFTEVDTCNVVIRIHLLITTIKRSKMAAFFMKR